MLGLAEQAPPTRSPSWRDEVAVIGFDEDVYKVARAAAESHRVTVGALPQVQQMVQMVAGAEVLKVARAAAESHRVTVGALPQVQQMVQMVAGAEVYKLARTLPNLQKLAIPTVLDTQRIAEVARSILATITVPAEAAMDEGVVRAVGAVSGRAPLLPGLANPWQQVRSWDLKDWVLLVLTMVTVLIMVAQLRSPACLTPQEVEQIIRSVQENATTSSMTPPSTTVSPSTTKPSTTKPSTSTVP